MTAAEMLDAAIRDARRLIADLERIATESDDPETVVRCWVQLEAIRDDAVTASKNVAEWGAQVLAGHGQYRLRVDDLPPVVRYTPKDRKEWRRDEIISVLRRLVPDTDRLMSPVTGEVEGDAEVLLRLVQDCISLGAGKVTGLRKHGLDPDEFSTTTPGVERLRIETQ